MIQDDQDQTDLLTEQSNIPSEKKDGSYATFSDDSTLSLSQRRAQNAIKAQQEKHEKLRNMLRSHSSPIENSLDTNSDEIPQISSRNSVMSASTSHSSNSAESRRRSIIDRFESAKVNQQKYEEERLARLKGESNRHNKKYAEKGVNLKNVWADALSESKTTEESRVQLTKKNNTQQIRLLNGSGYVKAKIGEWEELFMQIAATMDQLEDTLIAAQKRYQTYEMYRNVYSAAQIQEEQRKFRESGNVPEKFVLGDTHIYNSKFLENHVHTYLKHSLSDSRTRHIALTCGVYGEQSHKPQIDVFTAAIKTDDNSMYIALTIKSSMESAEEDIDCYGIYKVAIFSKDIGQKLLERVVEIVPAYTWNESNNYEDDSASYQMNLSSSFNAMDISDISGASDEGDGTWKTMLTPRKTFEGMDNPLNNPQSGFVRPRTTSGFDDLDGKDGFNYGRALSMATVGAARSFMPNLQRKESLNYAWGAEDEIDDGLPSAQQRSVEYDVSDVHSHYCSSNCFILEGSHQTLVFTGTLKAASTLNKYMIEGDTLFEWMRGPALSGWLTKWPMRSQSFGKRTRRFFVLRDHLLSYYNKKPQNEEEVIANYSPNSLHITSNSVVELGSHFFSRCIIISTPLDTLQIKAADDDEEWKWYLELKKSIDQQARCKLFLSKTRIESIWYHESENFSIVSSDAITQGNTYVKTSLFCYAKAPFYRGNSAKSLNNEVSFLSNTYSVDIGSSETDRVQLEVLLWDESPLIPSDLSCIKLYGNIVLLGGSKGYLAICAIRPQSQVDKSKSTQPLPANHEIPDGTPTVKNRDKRTPSIPLALYCFNCGGLSANSDSDYKYPHSPASTITCFATSYPLNLFLAADSKRVISVWSLEKNNSMSSTLNMKNLSFEKAFTQREGVPTMPRFQSFLSLTRVDPNGVYRDEKIKAMKLILNDMYVLVSTSSRLILFLFAHSSSVSHLTPISNISNSSDATINSRLNKSLYSKLAENILADCVKQDDANSSGRKTSKLASKSSPSVSKITARLAGWVELDRGIPGTEGVFCMHVTEKYVPVAPGAAVAEIKRKFIQWRLTSSFLTEIGDPTPADAAPPLPSSPIQMRPRTSFSRSFSFSRSNTVPSNNSYDEANPQLKEKRQCSLYRFEWSEEMFEAALNKLKPLL